MKKRFLTIIIALLCTFAGSWQTAMAESRTVTYKIQTASVSGSNAYNITFVRTSGTVVSNNDNKSVRVDNVTSTTGFTVNLDDGLSLQLSMTQGQLTQQSGSNNYIGFMLNHGSDHNTYLKLTSTTYYVTHVKMANLSGTAISGQASPWMASVGNLDTDVDMTTTTGLKAYRDFNAHIIGFNTFGQLTVTYGDPREYAITYNNAVNGQNGVTNTNATSYNVTSALNITAPTHTGYTLSGTTYTDAVTNSATAVTLPQVIKPGDAVTRKAITYNFSWTPITYTLRLHHNDGTGSYDDVNMTYDVSLTLPTLTRTDYVFNGWNTQADGNGTAYTDGQSVSNLAAEQGATVDLYAQWRQVAGSCGDNARWSYDDNGTLSITGTGGTYNFLYGNRPWEQYKDAITTVSIGSGITYIGEDAFAQCSNLATINGGKDLIYVGGAAFSGTLWLSAAIDSTTVVYLGHVAYCGLGVSGDVTLADGTITIANGAFQNNSRISSITIPASVTSIGDDAFRDCIGLTSVTIPASVTSIGQRAFFFCNVLQSVTIPASVTSIGDHAFFDCYGLSTVNVLATTPPTLGSHAFSFTINPISRTFNVRSAAYKDADEWTNIYKVREEYSNHNNFRLRVISTLTLPDGLTASADDAEKVTILDTDYYVEDAEITLSGLGAEHTTGDITYRSRATINYDNVDANADGQATFWMPDLDATVTVADFPYAVKYIDEDGTKKTCEHPTVIESSNNSQTLNNSDGWYVVLPGEVTISGHLYFENSDTYLILCDGATLTVSDNFNAIQAKDITIYGQTQGSGTVNATCDLCGIDAHDININGGTVNATSGAYGISASILNINGGTVNATSGAYGISASILNINGGTVNATANGEDNTYGINAGSIILGWTNPTDRIYANSYYDGGTINVNFGQTFWNGTEILSGMLYYYNGDEPTGDLTKLNGKTLEPCNTTPFFIDGTAILLDDDSAQPDGYKNADRIAALADGQPHDIMLLGRTLYRDGDWNTLCLPFTVDGYNNSANKLFYNAAIMKFDYSCWYDTNGKMFDTNTDGSHRSGEIENGSLYLNFIFGENNYIEAGRPYIVKWPDTELDNVEDPVFQGVTVTSTTPSYYTTEEGRDPQTGLGNVTFRGTYSPIDYTEDNHSILFLGTNNTLYYPEAGAHIGAFRCYFELGNGLTAGEPNSAVRGFNLNFDEQGTQTTGIIGHTDITDSTDKADAAWYSLDGRKLEGKPTKKGVYIHNGRVVVK